MAVRMCAVLASALLGTALSGCGGGDTLPEPEVVPVSGQVSRNGKPVAGMSITFTPQSEKGYTASARTDDQGRYVGRTSHEGELLEGIAPGKYQVVFLELRDASGSGASLTDAGDPTKGAIITGGTMPLSTTAEVRDATDSLDFDLDKLARPMAPPGMGGTFPGR